MGPTDASRRVASLADDAARAVFLPTSLWIVGRPLRHVNGLLLMVRPQIARRYPQAS